MFHYCKASLNIPLKFNKYKYS